MTNRIMLIGADPEILVARRGVVSHCIGLLGGSKEKPRPVLQGAVQEDNVAFEFNIDPTDSRLVFDDRVITVMNQGIGLLGSEFSITNLASHIYTPEELSNMPEAAMVFGCDPDMNALTGRLNPAPRSADPGLRSAGGHIHIGFGAEQEIDENKQRIAGVMCDYFLGLPSLLLDTDTRRRELYGKAGAMRAKGYGMEYRTLSNFWVHSQANRLWAFDQAKKAYENMDSFRDLTALFSPDQVQDVINSDNKPLAEQMIRAMEIC